MNRPEANLPAGAELLQASRYDGTSNALLFFPNENPPLVLKLYRVRRSRRREGLRQFSNRFIERKRGASPTDRYQTEKEGLVLWLREGFPVVEPVERPLPPEVDPPAMWLVYCPAPLLSDRLREEADEETRLALIRGYARELCRRQLRAFELDEPLLLQEHPALDHVFVDGDRFITFDLENGFLPDYSVLEAATQEVAGFLRTLARQMGPDYPPFLRAFVEGYTDRELLARLAQHAVHGQGTFRAIKRWHDRRKRPTLGKTMMMEALLRVLDS